MKTGLAPLAIHLRSRREVHDLNQEQPDELLGVDEDALSRLGVAMTSRMVRRSSPHYYNTTRWRIACEPFTAAGRLAGQASHWRSRLSPNDQQPQSGSEITELRNHFRSSSAGRRAEQQSFGQLKACGI